MTGRRTKGSSRRNPPNAAPRRSGGRPVGKSVLAGKSAKRAEPCLAKSKRKPRIGFGPVRGLVSFLALLEVSSGVREIPAPAARKEQQSNGQYQQTKQQRPERCVAHVDVCCECHGRMPGLNAKR